MYVHSDHVYVFLITKTKKIPLRNKLEDVEHYLPAQNFQRIHQRYVVNIDHLTKVTSEAVFIENIELPLSKKYKNLASTHEYIYVAIGLEVRSQKSEVRRQKSEVRSQKSEYNFDD